MDRASTPRGEQDVAPDPRLPIVIAGAGLSGLSLACALLEARITRPIVLIDRRREWARDRTWCTWETARGGAVRFTDLADHRWPGWSIRGPGGVSVMRSAATPYVHLRGDVVYRHALDRLAAAPQVTLLSGERVREIRPVPAEPGRGSPAAVVVTDRRSLDAGEVFDARGAGSPRGAAAGATGLFQRFLGWEVETGEPAFDPQVATLMDFRGTGRDDLRFLYVLPFSRHRALVEDTSFGTVAIAAEARRAMLERDLSERLGVREWQVLHEERGKIPMSARRVALHPAPGVHAIGIAAGAARPSSGYAFSRIQAHCSAIAASLARGTPLPDRLAPRRRSTLDAIFVRALAERPETFPELFLRLARRVPAPVFARFMADASTTADDLRVVAALAHPAFLAAVGESAVRATARRRPGR